MKLVPLGELMPSRIPSVNPGAFPDEQFTLWSIPSYDVGEPELVLGRDVGSSKKTVQDGDVLLSKIVPHIRRAWKVSVSNGHRQIASSEWITLRHDAFLSDYIRHFLLTNQFHRQFMGTVTGVGGSLLRAQPKSVAKIGIPLLPFDEQRRIVRLLDRAAEIRRCADAARAKARAIVPALFTATFGDPATNPMGWPQSRFGEVVSEFRYGTNQKCHDVQSKGDVAVLRIPNVIGSRIDWSNLKFASLPDKECAKTALRNGDVLFVRTNGNPEYIGRCAVFDGERQASYASYLIRARLTSDLLPTFTVNHFNHERYRNFVVRAGRTTAGNFNLSTEGLGALSIMVPPITLQTAFAEKVQRIEALARTLDTAAAKAEALAASLSAEVFDRARPAGFPEDAAEGDLRLGGEPGEQAGIGGEPEAPFHV